jgi:hypothetical protein
MTALEAALGEVRGYLRSLEIQYLASRRERVRQTRGLVFGEERVFLEPPPQAQWFGTVQKLMQAGLRVNRNLAKVLRPVREFQAEAGRRHCGTARARHPLPQ